MQKGRKIKEDEVNKRRTDKQKENQLMVQSYRICDRLIGEESTLNGIVIFIMCDVLLASNVDFKRKSDFFCFIILSFVCFHFGHDALQLHANSSAMLTCCSNISILKM